MCSVYRLLSLLKCHTSQEANLAKASLAKAGIKKQHLPKKTGSMREFKCSHICAFTPTTSLPSSAAFLQVKMTDEDHADAIVGEVGGKFSHHHNQHDRES